MNGRTRWTCAPRYMRGLGHLVVRIAVRRDHDEALVGPGEDDRSPTAGCGNGQKLAGRFESYGSRVDLIRRCHYEWRV